MTRDQALSLKVGDRVSIQRAGRPSPNLGTVCQIASEVRIQWDSYIWNGEEDGDERRSYDAGLMDRIQIA
jgi:hypothetical protein